MIDLFDEVIPDRHPHTEAEDSWAKPPPRRCAPLTLAQHELHNLLRLANMLIDIRAGFDTNALQVSYVRNSEVGTISAYRINVGIHTNLH